MELNLYLSETRYCLVWRGAEPPTRSGKTVDRRIFWTPTGLWTAGAGVGPALGVATTGHVCPVASSFFLVNRAGTSGIMHAPSFSSSLK